jgi:hypothetical protein
MSRKFWTIAVAFLSIACLASVATAQQRRSNPRRATPDGGLQIETPADDSQGENAGNGNPAGIPADGNPAGNPGNGNQRHTPNNDSTGGTPDGSPPSEEATCDDLKYGTPGLYGLCIAFCEAHDCVPDYSLENPFANCKKNDRKILDKYRRKMKDGDPDMPCLPSAQDDPQTACLCWSQDQLSRFPYSLSVPGVQESWLYCAVDVGIVDDEDDDPCYQTLNYINETGVLSDGVVHFNITAVNADCGDGTYCAAYIACEGSDCPEDFDGTEFGMDLTQEEYEVCKQQISQASVDCN